ncbi:MAG: DNA polymerase III subunit delta [Candidatus Kerfeldbacteria bacterium]|nr:DNA polymerase III subunit delta [Candidatus Kerfeldbacteria bacterium]
MIFLLHGPDTYRLRQRLSFYREGFKKKYDPAGYHVTSLLGESLTLEKFREAVGQGGLLAAKRFIVIEQLLSIKKTTVVEAIASYLSESKHDDNVLIFVEEETADAPRPKGRTKANPLRAFLDEHATAESFSLLTGTQLISWIQQEVKRRGGSIAPAAAADLATRLGGDLWAVSAEIEKLINFTAGKSITETHVAEMVHSGFDENIFHLTDALAARDGKLATRLLHDQFAAGAAPLYLLTMLIRQMRILLQVHSLAQSEPHPATIAHRLGIHPFVAQKAVRDVRKFQMEELVDVYRQLLDTDIALKTTSRDPRVLLDMVIARLCSVKN